MVDHFSNLFFLFKHVYFLFVIIVFIFVRVHQEHL